MIRYFKQRGLNLFWIIDLYGVPKMFHARLSLIEANLFTGGFAACKKN